MIELTIKNETGLHARPAAVFCTAAKKYEADVTLTKDGSTYNAKSVMMIMTAGIECGDKVVLEAKGSDSSQAEKELAAVLEGLDG